MAKKLYEGVVAIAAKSSLVTIPNPTELGQNLGTAIASIYVPLLDPELVVIGGGVSAVGDRLLAPIRSSFELLIPAKGYRPELKIIKAKFLNQAGLIGAADLARHSVS
jgi:glucokinase